MPTPPEIHLLAPNAAPTIFEALARLHAEEISGGFLTSLGTPLLKRLYRAIAGSPDAFVLIFQCGSGIGAFLCASTDTKRVYRHVLRRAWPHLLPVIIRKALSRHTIQRCWETLRYPSRQQVAEGPKAEILNFCVSGRIQRTGVGRQLFAAMEAEYRRRGVNAIRIVTGAGQHSAIRFYEKVGAIREASIQVHAKADSHLFLYTIRDCQQSGPAES